MVGSFTEVSLYGPGGTILAQACRWRRSSSSVDHRILIEVGGSSRLCSTTWTVFAIGRLLEHEADGEDKRRGVDNVVLVL